MARQRVKHAAFRRLLGASLDVLSFALPGQRDGDLDQIAHDLLHVSTNVADFGELGRFDLEKGRAREFRKATRDFRFADAGRPDHQDILRQHFLAQPLFQFQPPPPIAQRNRDRALGVGLTDDETVELRDDLARRESGVHDEARLSMTMFSLV